MTSPCGVEHTYACKIALGELQDDTYFPYVCALDEDDDPDDEECWIKTNPSLPVLPGNEYIRDMIATAKGMPSKRAVVDRLIFCKWTDAESPWIDADAYDAVVVDDLEREGECFAGAGPVGPNRPDRRRLGMETRRRQHRSRAGRVDPGGHATSPGHRRPSTLHRMGGGRASPHGARSRDGLRPGGRVATARHRYVRTQVAGL